MRIDPFHMERYQSLYENTVRYNLSESGVSPLRVADLLEGKEARDALLQASLGYPWGNGSPKLRANIARFYPGAKAENVTVTNGGSEANYTIFTALLDAAKGGRAAIQIPNYMQAWGLGRFFGAGSDAFHLVHDGSRWTLDERSLARAVGKRTKLILVTNPNNPTGSVLTSEEMDVVIAAADRAGAWLVVDEIYRGAELTAKRTSPTFWGRYDRLLITSGLSKAFGMPGARIGWVVGPPETVEQLWSYRDYTTLTPSALGDHFATIAMAPARRNRILARTREIVRSQWPILEGWLHEHQDILHWTPPDAGAIAFVGYRLPIRPGELFERLRTERSVLINGADHYGLRQDARYFRVGFGYDPDVLRKGLAEIGRFLRRTRA